MVEHEQLPIHVSHAHLFTEDYQSQFLKQFESDRKRTLVYMKGELEYPFRFPSAKRDIKIDSEDSDGNTLEKPTPSDNPQSFPDTDPGITPSSTGELSQSEQTPGTSQAEVSPSIEKQQSSINVTDQIFVPKTVKDDCFIKDLMRSSHWDISLRLLKEQNPAFISAYLENEQVLVKLSDIKQTTLGISDGERVVTRIQLVRKQDSYTYMAFIKSLVSKWEMPSSAPIFDPFLSPIRASINSTPNSKEGQPTLVPYQSNPVEGGYPLLPTSFDPSVLNFDKDFLIDCVEKTVNLLSQKTRIYDSNGFQPTYQKISLLFVDDFKNPFAVLKATPDGNCGYHSIVRHFVPHIDVDSMEYNQYVIDLREAVKMHNLRNWSYFMETQLLEDYPYLKGKPGSLVRNNYAQSFRSLDLSLPDFLAISLILSVKFVILRVPLDNRPSLSEIYHGSLDPKSLHSIGLLQTGANTNPDSTERPEHRSHYDPFIPITEIDGISVDRINSSEIMNKALKSTNLTNRYIKFNFHGLKHVQCYPSISLIHTMKNDSDSNKLFPQFISEYNSFPVPPNVDTDTNCEGSSLIINDQQDDATRKNLEKQTNVNLLDSVSDRSKEPISSNPIITEKVNSSTPSLSDANIDSFPSDNEINIPQNVVPSMEVSPEIDPRSPENLESRSPEINIPQNVVPSMEVSPEIDSRSPENLESRSLEINIPQNVVPSMEVSPEIDSRNPENLESRSPELEKTGEDSTTLLIVTKRKKFSFRKKLPQANTIYETNHEFDPKTTVMTPLTDEEEVIGKCLEAEKQVEYDPKSPVMTPLSNESDIINICQEREKQEAITTDKTPQINEDEIIRKSQKLDNQVVGCSSETESSSGDCRLINFPSEQLETGCQEIEQTNNGLFLQNSGFPNIIPVIGNSPSNSSNYTGAFVDDFPTHVPLTQLVFDYQNAENLNINDEQYPNIGKSPTANPVFDTSSENTDKRSEIITNVLLVENPEDPSQSIETPETQTDVNIDAEENPNLNINDEQYPNIGKSATVVPVFDTSSEKDLQVIRTPNVQLPSEHSLLRCWRSENTDKRSEIITNVLFVENPEDPPQSIETPETQTNVNIGAEENPDLMSGNMLFSQSMFSAFTTEPLYLSPVEQEGITSQALINPQVSVSNDDGKKGNRLKMVSLPLPANPIVTYSDSDNADVVVSETDVPLTFSAGISRSSNPVASQDASSGVPKKTKSSTMSLVVDVTDEIAGIGAMASTDAFTTASVEGCSGIKNLDDTFTTKSLRSEFESNENSDIEHIASKDPSEIVQSIDLFKSPKPGAMQELFSNRLIKAQSKLKRKKVREKDSPEVIVLDFDDDPVLKQCRLDHETSLRELIDLATESIDDCQPMNVQEPILAIYRPDNMDNIWESVSDSQYKPITIDLNKIAPLNDEIRKFILDVSYISPIDGSDFTFNDYLLAHGRVFKYSRYTDPKKVSGLSSKNNNFINNISRYFTFIANYKNLEILQDHKKIFESLEDIHLMTKFLMNLIENGRKMDVIERNIESFTKYHQFLMNANFLPKINNFKDNVKQIWNLLHPIILFQTDRRARNKQEKAENLENYSPKDLSRSIREGEFDYVMEIWSHTEFTEIDRDDLAFIINLAMCSIYTLYCAFNGSRKSDGTTVTVNAVQTSLDESELLNSPHEEILTIFGNIENKNTHYAMPHNKRISGSVRTYRIIWPTYLKDILKQFLVGLSGAKLQLKNDGIDVDEQAFFMNAKGQLADRNDFAKWTNLTRKVYKIEFSTRNWRIYVSTMAKERQMQASLTNYTAIQAQHDMECVSQHMQHTEACADAHYRVTTKDMAVSAGKFISTILKIPTKRVAAKSPDPTSSKRICLEKNDDESNKIDNDSSGSGVPAQHEESNVADVSEQFKDRIASFLKTCNDRNDVARETETKLKCEKYEVKYSPPRKVNENELVKKRRKNRNHNRIYKMKMKLNESTISDDSEEEESSGPILRSKR